MVFVEGESGNIGFGTLSGSEALYILHVLKEKKYHWQFVAHFAPLPVRVMFSYKHVEFSYLGPLGSLLINVIGVHENVILFIMGKKFSPSNHPSPWFDCHKV